MMTPENQGEQLHLEDGQFAIIHDIGSTVFGTFEVNPILFPGQQLVSDEELNRRGVSVFGRKIIVLNPGETAEVVSSSRYHERTLKISNREGDAVIHHRRTFPLNLVLPPKEKVLEHPHV